MARKSTTVVSPDGSPAQAAKAMRDFEAMSALHSAITSDTKKTAAPEIEDLILGIKTKPLVFYCGFAGRVEGLAPGNENFPMPAEIAEVDLGLRDLCEEILGDLDAVIDTAFAKAGGR